MFCPNCGKEISENAEFCGYCGYHRKVEESVANAEESNFSYDERNENINNMATSVSADDIKSVLVDATEDVIATFGNSYLASMVVSNKLEEYAYILTDKRLYYKGEGYYSVADSKTMDKVEEEFIVDLNDISCTGFIRHKTVNSFLMGIFVTVGILSAISIGFVTQNYDFDFLLAPLVAILILSILGIIVLFILADIRSGTYFIVNFNGGKIEAKIGMMSLQSASDFNKQIRKAKGSIE